MTTLNIEKSTRERINDLRRGARTYDDILNRMADEIIELESLLKIPYSEIHVFIRWLTNIEDVENKLEKFLLEK